MILCANAMTGRALERVLETVELGKEDLVTMRKIVNSTGQFRSHRVIMWLYEKDRS